MCVQQPPSVRVRPVRFTTVQSPAYGLAVDNVLQLTAVLANGSEVVASPCSHPDLFWALRGGGGGTFGVLTSVTYRLHPTQPVTGFVLTLAFLRGGSGALFLDGFLSLLPDFLAAPSPGDGVWGGYTTFSATYFSAVWVFNGTLEAAQASASAAGAFIASHPEDFYTINSTWVSR